MYYLRQYTTILKSTNGEYTELTTTLSKADCYGIMKRNHVYSTPSYDDNYITQYNNTRTIKHPTLDLWCVELSTTEGLNPLYLNYLESRETLELDGWVIDGDGNTESIPYEEIIQPPSLEDRLTAIEEVMMMLLI